MMKRLLLALVYAAALAVPLAIAGSSAYVVRDGNGNIISFGATTDAGGNLYGNAALVDGTNANVKAAVTGGNALKVDASATTQPVTDPVLELSPGTPLAGLKGPLMQGSASTAAPTYTTGTINPLSLDLAGNLRINCTTGCGGGGGASSSFAAAFPATGTAIGVKNGANMVNLAADASSNLLVNLATALPAGSNSIGTVVLGSGAATIGALTANQSVNLTQVAGNAVATAASGIAKVGLTDGSGTALTSTGSALDINLKTSAATVNVGTHTATQFLFAAGTNGFTVTPFSVLTTELNALASAGVATSSVNGTSGKFSQATTGNALFGRCWVTLGAALGGAASAGANFAIWFLTSTDGGTTFESQTVNPPPRSPDIIIPVGANAYGANAVLMSPPRQNLWAETVKIVFQNNTGQAMGASGNVMTCAPQASTN